MAWRDELRPASFRGVPFRVEAAEFAGGRRGELHEYPRRDRPFFEDLGRRARTYPVDAYVIGPDYMAARDALAEALEREGPGELIHPYLGALQVTAPEYRAVETREQGGMAAFQITFIEAGENLFPTVTADTQELALDAGDEAELELQDGFLALYDPGPYPSYGVSALAEVLTGVVDAVEAAGALIIGVAATVAEAVDAAAISYAVASALTGRIELAGRGASRISNRALARFALAGKAALMRRSAAELVAAPEALAAAMVDLVGSSVAGRPAPARAVRAMVALTAAGEDLIPPPRPAPTEQRVRASAEAIVRLARGLAAVGAARASAARTWSSYDSAAAARAELEEAVDLVAIAAADAGDDLSHRGLQTLRQAAIADITARGSPLARMRTITLGDSLPAVVLAYRLYGDPEPGERIARQNRAPHPGFLPAGRRLRVREAA